MSRFFVGGLSFALAFLAGAAAWPQIVGGPGPVGEFQFASDARAPGRVYGSFTRSTSTTTCYLDVDGFSGMTPPPTLTTEMAGDMCRSPGPTTTCWGNGSLSCTNPSPDKVCIQSTSSSSVTRWTVTCKSTTLVPMGVVIASVGTGDVCSPLRNPDGGIPPQPLVISSPPRIGISGGPVPGSTALVKIQAGGGPEVEIHIPDNLSLQDLGSVVTAELFQGGYQVENEGIEPSPSDGTPLAYIRILEIIQTATPVRGVDSYIYANEDQDPPDTETGSPLIYEVQIEGRSVVPFPALSTWGVVAGGLLVLAIGCLLLKRRREAATQAA